MALTRDQQWATEWGRRNGLLSGNETATGGLLDSRLASNPQLRQTYQGELSNFRNQVSAQGGVMPAHIEPMHQYERAGLQSFGNREMLGGGGMVDGQAMLRELIADPQAAIAKFTNPQATAMMNKASGFYDKADAATQSGMAPIEQDDIRKFFNPFEEDVIDYATDKAKAGILANEGQRGAASFGGTATGVRMSELDRIPFEYRYKGWNDAAGMATDERNRSLTGAGIYGDLGSRATNTGATAQGITNHALSNALGLPSALFEAGERQTNTNVNAINRQIGAGQTIRGFNQGINNEISTDFVNRQQFPVTNMAQIQGLLSPFNSQTGENQQATNIGRAGQIAGGVGSIASVIGGFL